MIPEALLMRLLMVALERLPDHRVVLDGPTWAAMVAKAHAQPSRGIIFEQHDGGATTEVRLADHEDRAVMLDRMRKSGAMIIETPDMVVGLGGE